MNENDVAAPVEKSVEKAVVETPIEKSAEKIVEKVAEKVVEKAVAPVAAEKSVVTPTAVKTVPLPVKSVSDITVFILFYFETLLDAIVFPINIQYNM